MGRGIGLLALIHSLGFRVFSSTSKQEGNIGLLQKDYNPCSARFKLLRWWEAV